WRQPPSPRRVAACRRSCPLRTSRNPSRVGARCDTRTPIDGKVDGPRYVSNQGLWYASWRTGVKVNDEPGEGCREPAERPTIDRPLHAGGEAHLAPERPQARNPLAGGSSRLRTRWRAGERLGQLETPLDDARDQRSERLSNSTSSSPSPWKNVTVP